VLQAGRREAGRVQQEAGIEIAAFQRGQLHVARGLDQLQLHARVLGAEAAHPAGQQAKPTVDTKPRRSRPASPPAAARACAGRACARASRSRACGSSAAPASVSCTLRLVRSNRRTSSRRSSWAIACVSGGCVMCRRAAARPKCRSRRRPRTGATAQFDQGLAHMPRILMDPGKGIGWNHRRGVSCGPSSEPTRGHAMAEQKIQLHLRSDNITQGKSRAPNRSMYYGMGYKETDFGKPMVGVANGHSTITPCNSGLQKLADAAVQGIEDAGGNPQIFGTPTISDGMAMGTEGMKYSLVSREVIADCIETCVQGQWMDGVVVVGGCDKNMPGGMMGMLRANVPAIYVYGGTILPGKWKGQDLNIVSVFEAVGQNAAGKISDAGPQGDRAARHSRHRLLRRHVHRQHHELGLRGAGHVLPYSSTMANPHDEKQNSAKESAKVLVEAIKKDIKPRDIVTQEGAGERGGRDHGHRRLDQRGAALPGHRACGRGRVDHRRLRAHPQAHAGDLRPQALGQVPGGRPAPGRRHPAGDEGAAEGRPAARRLHHHHRPDHRRGAEGHARCSRARTRT
jgi:hypothetical protein